MTQKNEQLLDQFLKMAFDIDLLELDFEDQMRLYKIRQLAMEIEENIMTDCVIDELFDFTEEADEALTLSCT